MMIKKYGRKKERRGTRKQRRKKGIKEGGRERESGVAGSEKNQKLLGPREVLNAIIWEMSGFQDLLRE